MKTKTVILIFLITFPALLFLFSCDTTNPYNKGAIELTAEDASCTEVWLNVKTKSISLPTELRIIRNDSTVITTNINSNDTTLYIDNLLPNKTYNFQTIIQSTNQKSNSVSVTTMDTTSHNFTWETFTFGGVNGSSYLKDVAIINENDIWAVGLIHTAETDQFDSNGVWVQPYNAVHWNGQKWELKRILYNNNFWTINTILAFNENDIWFDVFVHWNGSSFSNDAIPNVLMGWRSNSLWGTSSEDFYVVGTGGKIAHYNGSRWTKIESGTELKINDIWGDYNKKRNKWEILCVASDLQYNSDRVLLEIDNKKARKVNLSPISQPLLSIWFKSNRKYYLVGSGIYTKNNLSEELWSGFPREFTDYTTNSVAAKDINDIIICGDFNEVLHYNGIGWKSYREIELPNSYGRLLNITYKNNIVAIVGQYGNKGILYIGER